MEQYNTDDKGIKSMIKKGLAGLIVDSAIIVGSTIFLGGCINQNSCQTKGALNLAEKISRTNTSQLIKEQSKNFIVYHSKDLKVEKGFLGYWPQEGNGIFIELYNNGNLNIAEWDCAKMDQLENKEIKPFELTGAGFSYDKDNSNEQIFLSDNGSLVTYTNSDKGWQKICYDTKKLEEGMELESIPILSKENIDVAEVQKYLDLVDRIRKNLSP